MGIVPHAPAGTIWLPVFGDAAKPHSPPGVMLVAVTPEPGCPQVPVTASVGPEDANCT